jgi:hypothetical protein
MAITVMEVLKNLPRTNWFKVQGSVNKEYVSAP